MWSEKMDVKCQRVAFKHALMGRTSSKSESSLSGEVVICVGFISSGAVGLPATVITLEAVFSFVFLATGLVAAIDLGFGFLGPAVSLVAATLDCVGDSVTG